MTGTSQICVSPSDNDAATRLLPGTPSGPACFGDYLASLQDRGAVNGKPCLGNSVSIPGVLSGGFTRMPSRGRRKHMLGWALVFLVVALIAGLLGFTGLAMASAGIAQILFYIFVVLFVVSSLIYLIRGRAPPTV
jgi:uncharacterized membrane protein YtjA (UPF0391 family)